MSEYKGKHEDSTWQARVLRDGRVWVLAQDAQRTVDRQKARIKELEQRSNELARALSDAEGRAVQYARAQDRHYCEPVDWVAMRTDRDNLLKERDELKRTADNQRRAIQDYQGRIAKLEGSYLLARNMELREIIDQIREAVA